MNFHLVFNLAGNVLKCEALLMILPMVISFYYKEGGIKAYLISIGITFVVGFTLSCIKPKFKKFDVRESFACVAVVWILLALFGALPFYTSNYFSGFTDSLFEAVAAITTTGASVLPDTESLPKGLLFWRSFMQWMGGMGILVFILAVMPQMGTSGLLLLKAESTGPSPEKFVPKIKETAAILYVIYSSMTFLLIILLLVTGLPLYDSIINAFGTASTGGFSNKNLSIGAYNNFYVEAIITIFMFLFSINFSLYYHVIKKNYKVFKDEEFLFYIGIVIVSVLIITINLHSVNQDFARSLRYASFHVTSVISTTCYSTTDYNYWPSLSRAILIFITFTGGCAGSTSGGFKISRIIIMIKTVRVELNKIIKPRVVNTVKLNGKMIGNELISLVFLYFFLYVLVIAIAFFLLSFDNKDIVSTFTAVLGAVSNVGPGLEAVSPSNNFSSFTPFSKIILSLCMITGRLEIFPIVILFKAIGNK